MKMISRTTLAEAGLIAAAIAVCLLPLRGQTQESSADRVDFGKGTLEVPVPPRAPDRPVGSNAPRASDSRTSDEGLPKRLREGSGGEKPSMELGEQIAKEIEERFRIELQANPKGFVVEEAVKRIMESMAKLKVHRQTSEYVQKALEDQGRNPNERDRSDWEKKMGFSVYLGEPRGPKDDEGVRWKKRHGRRFELETHALLETYRHVPEAKRPEFVEKLTKVVSEHFDDKQSTRESELKKLEAELKQLRFLHEQRAKEKKEIVQDRVRQLTREAAGLGWGGDRSNPDLSDDKLDVDENDDANPDLLERR